MLRNKMKLPIFQRNKPHRFTVIMMAMKYVILLCAAIHIQFTCQCMPNQNLAVTVQLSIEPLFVNIAVWFLAKSLYHKAR